MPLTFPMNLMPSAINDRTAPDHSVSRFQSEAGYDTRVCLGCAGHSTSFQLQFDLLDTVEEAQLLKFWMEIGGSSAGSCRSFLIPDCWDGWGLIKTFPVWREGFLKDDLDRHWWIVTNRISFNGDLCFFQSTGMTIENIHRRA